MNINESSLYAYDLKRAVGLSQLDFLNNKKVLITGGTGLIGSSIVDLILMNNKCTDANTMVYVASRNSNSVVERFGDLEFIKWVKYDALDSVSFNEKVNYIIHCAGNASPDLYISRAVETMVMNFSGMNNLLFFAKEIGTDGVLYLSSSEVYGKKGSDLSYKEEDYGFVDLLSPRSSYASSKRASETLCSAYAEEYGIRTLITRPGHVFGPTATKKDKRISSSFAYDAANGENLVLKSTGSQIRSYMYCIDCARAILLVLEKGNSGEAYNICGRETASIKEMAKIYARAGGVSLSYKEPTEEEMNSFNPMDNASLDETKISDLGFIPGFSIEEGLVHTVLILKELIKGRG